MVFRALVAVVALCLSLAAVHVLANEMLLEEPRTFTATRMVQLAHRHGSRSPIVPYNQAEICGPKGCGVLNAEGVDMLRQLGRWVRNHWNSEFSQLCRNGYNFNEVWSRSTDLHRTIQSSEAMLTGIFPDAPFLPVVHTVNFETDELLLIEGQQSYNVHFQLTLHSMQEYIGKLAAEKTITVSLMNELSEASGLREYCQSAETNVTKRLAEHGSCALIIQDIAAAMEAQGKLPPNLKLWFPTLTSLLIEYNRIRFAYDPNNHFHTTRGALGYNLASTILSQFTAQSQGFGVPFFKEYSTHDTTMTPLYTTVGNENYLPNFGQTVIFELVEVDSVFYVQAYTGYPIQTPSNHSYDSNMQRMKLTCRHPNQTEYTDMRCSLADWGRFIESRKGSFGNSRCYVSPEDIHAIGCDRVGEVPLHPLCIVYRRDCPSQGCPKGTLLNHTDFSCRRVA